MELRVFSIRDEKVGAYLQPFFSPTAGSAIRSVTDIVNNPDHQMSKHAQDFVLFELGIYDDVAGSFKTHDAPRSLGVLLEYKKQ